MKRKLASVFIEILLAAIITATLTACGNQDDALNSSQTSDAVSSMTISDGTASQNNPDVSIPESTAIDDITITIPDEFKMDTETAQADSTFFKLKVPEINTADGGNNNGSNGNGTTNGGSNGSNGNGTTNGGDNGSNGNGTTSGGSNGSNGNGTTSGGSNGSNGAGNGDNNTDNSDPSENVIIRVVNIEATETNFQNSLNNPATPESMTEYLTNVRGLPNVVFTSYQQEIMDDQIRYEYSYTYTYNDVTYTELEFSCITKDKFVAITVYPKSDAYLQQAQQVLRQMVDSFNPYK